MPSGQLQDKPSAAEPQLDFSITDLPRLVHVTVMGNQTANEKPQMKADHNVTNQAPASERRGSWRTFFDHEKTRHSLWITKYRQYKELLVALRQGYALADPYKPPVELPGPERFFDSEYDDDYVAKSQCDFSLDLPSSLSSCKTTSTTRSIDTNPMSSQDSVRAQRTTIALVVLCLFVLFLSVTVGIILLYQLNKDDSWMNDNNQQNGTNNSMTIQESFTKSSHHLSSTLSLIPMTNSSSSNLFILRKNSSELKLFESAPLSHKAESTKQNTSTPLILNSVPTDISNLPPSKVSQSETVSTVPRTASIQNMMVLSKNTSSSLGTTLTQPYSVPSRFYTSSSPPSTASSGLDIILLKPDTVSSKSYFAPLRPNTSSSRPDSVSLIPDNVPLKPETVSSRPDALSTSKPNISIGDPFSSHPGNVPTLPRIEAPMLINVSPHPKFMSPFPDIMQGQAKTISPLPEAVSARLQPLSTPLKQQRNIFTLSLPFEGQTPNVTNQSTLKSSKSTNSGSFQLPTSNSSTSNIQQSTKLSTEFSTQPILQLHAESPLSFPTSSTTSTPVTQPSPLSSDDSSLLPFKPSRQLNPQVYLAAQNSSNSLSPQLPRSFNQQSNSGLQIMPQSTSPEKPSEDSKIYTSSQYSASDKTQPPGSTNSYLQDNNTDHQFPLKTIEKSVLSTTAAQSTLLPTSYLLTQTKNPFAIATAIPPFKAPPSSTQTKLPNLIPTSTSATFAKQALLQNPLQLPSPSEKSHTTTQITAKEFTTENNRTTSSGIPIQKERTTDDKLKLPAQNEYDLKTQSPSNLNIQQILSSSLVTPTSYSSVKIRPQNARTNEANIPLGTFSFAFNNYYTSTLRTWSIPGDSFIMDSSSQGQFITLPSILKSFSSISSTSKSQIEDFQNKNIKQSETITPRTSRAVDQVMFPFVNTDPEIAENAKQNMASGKQIWMTPNTTDSTLASRIRETIAPNNMSMSSNDMMTSQPSNDKKVSHASGLISSSSNERSASNANDMSSSNNREMVYNSESIMSSMTIDKKANFNDNMYPNRNDMSLNANVMTTSVTSDTQSSDVHMTPSRTNDMMSSHFSDLIINDKTDIITTSPQMPFNIYDILRFNRSIGTTGITKYQMTHTNDIVTPNSQISSANNDKNDVRSDSNDTSTPSALIIENHFPNGKGSIHTKNMTSDDSKPGASVSNGINDITHEILPNFSRTNSSTTNNEMTYDTSNAMSNDNVSAQVHSRSGISSNNYSKNMLYNDTNVMTYNNITGMSSDNTNVMTYNNITGMSSDNTKTMTSKITGEQNFDEKNEMLNDTSGTNISGNAGLMQDGIKKIMTSGNDTGVESDGVSAMTSDNSSKSLTSDNAGLMSSDVSKLNISDNTKEMSSDRKKLKTSENAKGMVLDSLKTVSYNKTELMSYGISKLNFSENTKEMSSESKIPKTSDNAKEMTFDSLRSMSMSGLMSYDTSKLNSSSNFAKTMAYDNTKEKSSANIRPMTPDTKIISDNSTKIMPSGNNGTLVSENTLLETSPTGKKLPVTSVNGKSTLATPNPQAIKPTNTAPSAKPAGKGSLSPKALGKIDPISITSTTTYNQLISFLNSTRITTLDNPLPKEKAWTARNLSDLLDSSLSHTTSETREDGSIPNGAATNSGKPLPLSKIATSSNRTIGAYRTSITDRTTEAANKTATTKISTQPPPPTTTIDPLASLHVGGSPDGGSMLFSGMDHGLRQPELQQGVLLDYSFMLRNLPPPEKLPKAMATKVAATPEPLTSFPLPRPPKPIEIQIIAPDVVAEIGMSPTSHLKVVCIARKAWGWTYIALSRYEGDSEFSLEFLGGVEKKEEFPFLPIDSRMSDYTLHRDEDQVTFGLETKHALCEDKGRYLCEITVNRTLYSKTFNVDVKKRPEVPSLNFPDDIFTGEKIWLVTTWDAGNPVIGNIVHDIVKGFTGLPFAAMEETTRSWYKDCAVMMENSYYVIPEASWNDTEIIARIIPSDNATEYEKSIVERVKSDRKTMLVLDRKICEGVNNLRLAHPYNNKKYITCYSNGPSVTKCPDGQSFDDLRKLCA